jgi:hypothetical protein
MHTRIKISRLGSGKHQYANPRVQPGACSDVVYFGRGIGRPDLVEKMLARIERIKAACTAVSSMDHGRDRRFAVR